MANSITVDELQVLVTANTKQLQKSFDAINDQLGDVQNSTSKFSSKSAALFGVVAGAAQALANKGINLITSSVSSAASRIDTLNNANRVFQNMGFSVDDTKTSMYNLNKSILGLPTSLNDAVGGVEALASVSGNLKDSQKTYTALNDGILAFGGSADMVKGAVLQLSQLPLDGPLDAQTWNSLRQNGLTPVFAAMAKDSHMSISQLKSDFGDGTLTVQDFTNKLQKLDTDGGGGMAALQKQAHDATKGIQTGWANMQTAITRGVADVMKAFGSANISSAISNIGKAFEGALKDVAGLIKFVADNKDVFGPLAVSISAAAAAMLLWTTYTKAAAIITAAYAVVSSYLTLVMSLQAQGLGIVRAAWMALNITMSANPIGIIIVAVAALVAGLIYFFTQTETGRKVFQTAMDAIKAAIEFVWNWIKDHWPLLLTILTGPIGLAVAMIIKHWDTVKNAFSAAWEFIKSVWSAASGFFSGVWNGITRALSSVKSWFGSVFSGAWNAVKSAFGGVSGFFNDVKNRIIGAFSGIGRSISSFFHNIWGSVGADLKSAINAVLHLPLTIPKISIPHVGTVGGQTLIPRLARGGIIDSATLALVGESGKEAVMPLENNTGWIDELAGKLNSKGGGGQPTQIIVKIGEDTILDKMIDGINGRSFLNGTSVLQV